MANLVKKHLDKISSIAYEVIGYTDRAYEQKKRECPIGTVLYKLPFTRKCNNCFICAYENHEPDIFVNLDNNHEIYGCCYKLKRIVDPDIKLMKVTGYTFEGRQIKQQFRTIDLCPIGDIVLVHKYKTTACTERSLCRSYRYDLCMNLCFKLVIPIDKERYIGKNCYYELEDI